MLMIEYPNMRQHLIFSIRTLADRLYQQKVWVEHQSPKEKYEDAFDFAVHFIFDDMNLDRNIDKAIGKILQDESEVKAVQLVIEAINNILDNMGLTATDEQYINSPYWDNVVLAAYEAYIKLTKGGDPNGLFEAIQITENSEHNN